MKDVELSPDAFQQIAPYYDELMSGVPYRMWVGYYLLLLSTKSQHPKTLLELGCGTGTLCELLHDEGFKVTGLDVSEPMILKATEKAKESNRKIAYSVQNASSFRFTKKFDGIFSFFDSLNNILEPNELQQAFATAFKHLNRGGTFAFDLNTSYAFEKKMFDQQSKRKDASLHYKWTGHWDKESRVITVTMQFWYKGKEFTEVHHQHAYEPDEVLTMLSNAGFTGINAYNSYGLDPPRANSDRVHYIALKPF